MRVCYSKYLDLLYRKPLHDSNTETHLWSSSLARLAAAAAMATLTAGGGTRGGGTRGGGAWRPGQQSCRCSAGGSWRRQLGAAAGGDIAGGGHAGVALLWRRGGAVLAADVRPG
mmetsp:Transcript_28916/g.92647  ORF Transcript_28916/g.92647 Transcript_28916/m.92647 type:complete len:114 (+) Transcript_28916:49-390(+)